MPRWFLQRWLLCKGPKTDLLAACFGGRFSWFSFEEARCFNDPLNLDSTFSWLLYSLAALPCPLVAPDMFAFKITHSKSRMIKIKKVLDVFAQSDVYLIITCR